MKKLFILLYISLLFISSLYASQFTTNYNLEIPSIGDRDWQPTISKDIISIDTVMGIISSDNAAQTIKINIISNDAAQWKTDTVRINIISSDSAIQDTKILIISNDAVQWKTDTTKINIISNDLVFVRNYTFPSVSPTAVGSVISYDGTVLKWGTISGTVGVTETAWTDYSATSTITGWVSFTTKQIWYKKMGRTVFIVFILAGTSNDTVISFTLPYVSAANNSFGGALQYATDNSALLTVASKSYLNPSSSTISCYANMGSGAWTNVGTKSVEGTLWYETTS